MKKYFYTMLALATIGLAACGGSAENNDAAADSTVTDTATFNTSSTDSLNMVDSAVKESTDGLTVDSSGGLKPVNK
jgi:ABC-type glycerol-3-phosphate transport system substrate-binding protein